MGFKETYLVDVLALHLRLRQEVVRQECTVISADSFDLIETLIGVKAELLVDLVQSLSLLSEHKLKSLSFVLKQFVRSTH